MTIVNNTANGNTKYGIEVEVSGQGHHRQQPGDRWRGGIILFNAADFKVFNNEVGGSNTLFGIKLAQDQRRQAKSGHLLEARDPAT